MLVDLFARVAANGARNRPLAEALSGQAEKAVSVAGLPRSLARLVRQAEADLQALLGRLESGAITLQQWEDEFQRILARAHTEAWLSGAGVKTLGDRGREDVPRAVQEQIEFLRGFARVVSDGVRSGDPDWEAYRRRASMYADSAGASWWRGRQGEWPLPAFPKDGTTQCLTRCRCHWQIDVIDQENGDADAYWKLGAVEHCQTCVQRAVMWNPLKIRGGVLQE